MSFNRQPLLEEGVSHVTATNSVDIGTRAWVGGNHYVYVYNAGNSEIPPGHGAVLIGGATNYSATVSATSADILAGVCKNATLTTGTYGWLVTEGFTTVEMGANFSATTGSLLEIGANGVFDIKSNLTAFGNVQGKALAGIASGASGAAYVRVL